MIYIFYFVVNAQFKFLHNIIIILFLLNYELTNKI